MTSFLRSFCEWNVGVLPVMGGVEGMLLGCGVSHVWWPVRCCVACVCAWCGVRVVVENCIVDASIFIVVCVCATWCCAKLCSAIGGCLGTKSR